MVSGDWRKIGSSLELVGILAVNTPGFPVPRARAGLVAGAQVSLIASGLCGCENEDLADEDDTDLEVIPAEFVEIEESAEVIESDQYDELAARLRLLDLAMWEETGIDFGSKTKKKGKPCCADCAEEAA